MPQTLTQAFSIRCFWVVECCTAALPLLLWCSGGADGAVVLWLWCGGRSVGAARRGGVYSRRRRSWDTRTPSHSAPHPAHSARTPPLRRPEHLPGPRRDLRSGREGRRARINSPRSLTESTCHYSQVGRHTCLPSPSPQVTPAGRGAPREALLPAQHPWA